MSIEVARGCAGTARNAFGSYGGSRRVSGRMTWRNAIRPDALDMAFGDAFSVRRITAQVTDEPITSGQVQTYLPWLPEQRGSLVELRSLDRIDNPITHRLNKASFIRRD